MTEQNELYELYELSQRKDIMFQQAIELLQDALRFFEEHCDGVGSPEWEWKWRAKYLLYDADIDEIRPYRRSIPVLLKPNDLTPENIHVGLQKCINEFNDNFQPSRRPWRTLVRIDDVDPDGKFFYVVVPGWDPQQVIRLRLQDLPENIKILVVEGQTTRLHAKVNLGAEANEDLYFEDWESQ